MKFLQISTIALVGASVILVGSLSQHAVLNLGWAAYAGLALFFLINVLSESQPLQLPGTKAGYAEITISGLSSYALIALFPTLQTAITGAAAVFVTEALIKKKSSVKWVFNTVQTFVSLVGASFIFHIINSPTLETRFPLIIVATLVAVFAYFFLNTGLVSMGLAQLTGQPVFRTWSSNFKWELLYVAGSVPIALLLIFAYQRLWIAGPLLFIAPLFLLRESYAQYIRLKTTYTETVRTLIKVIETHDTYTAGHSLRVAEYAKRLAVAAGVSVKEVEKIEIAAYLHDLGKVDLAITHLVRKPGRLTPEEKRRVQLHPLVSADLAAQVTYFRGDIERIIRHHHEHFNGTGYPHGLTGEDIPFGSRIILIADAFDAMTSNRMYRSALDLQRVKNEFIKYAGIQFDPQLVPLFLTQCVSNDAAVIPQIDIPYEELLSTQMQVANVGS